MLVSLGVRRLRGMILMRDAVMKLVEKGALLCSLFYFSERNDDDVCGFSASFE